MIKNNSIMKCCICNNEKMGEFITINDKKYHLCCIEDLKKQKDDVVELIKTRIKENEGHINARIEIYHYKNMLRMLGEIDE